MFAKREEKKSLKELLEVGPVFAPCVYDAISARMMYDIGFQATCLSGSETARTRAGLPDIGLGSFNELCSTIEHITDVCPLPMIVDVDTGWGNEYNVMRTCERIVESGAKAIHMEDQKFPKRCGHLEGKEVIGRDEYIRKIKAAHKVFEGTDVIIIARTDSYNVLGIEEAIWRNQAAHDAGAEVSFTEAIDSVAAMEEIGRRVEGWKMFGMASYGASPKVSFADMVSMGFNLVTFHCTMMAMVTGMTYYARECLERKDNFFAIDNAKYFKDSLVSPENLTDIAKWKDLVTSVTK